MIKRINPIAKAMAHHRKRKAIVPSETQTNGKTKVMMM
jgi:hypothetical protein